MVGGTQVVVASESVAKKKGLDLSVYGPISQLQLRFKDLENGFKTWLSKQSLPVESAIVTVTSAVQGAAIGAFMGILTNDISSSPLSPPQGASLNPQAMASLQQAQALSGGPLVQARNFAVMTGVNADLYLSLLSAPIVDVSFVTLESRRLVALPPVPVSFFRFTAATPDSMVAAFGSGAMFSLISGMGGPNQVTNMLTSGVFFTLVQGGLFKMGQKFSQPPAEDIYYSRTRSMLNHLGLENYEKNFKKGLLTDRTLPLLTDSALRDVKIPPGPRLLILDHVQRDPHLSELK